MDDRERVRHYSDFYEAAPFDPPGEGRPFAMVVGNCQTESLRILLDSTDAMDSIRIPPVFEWTATDLRQVQILLPRMDVLVIQPIRENYRELPCGTAQLEEQLRPSARSVRVPALRYAGVHPFTVIARDPQDPSLDPPLVPYHDLRTLVAAHRGSAVPEFEPTPQALRAAEQESIEQLRRREQHHGTVVMSDVLGTHPHWHTINHPDNPTLVTLADRVCLELGITAAATAPARELLGAVEAPVDPAAARALGAALREDALVDHWRIAGPPPRTHSLAGVAQAQLAFYRERPGLVPAALERHAQRLQLLGLQP